MRPSRGRFLAIHSDLLTSEHERIPELALGDVLSMKISRLGVVCGQSDP